MFTSPNNLLIFTPVMTTDTACLTSALLYQCSLLHSGTVTSVRLFSNRVVNRWNMLDQQIVGATGLNAFTKWIACNKKDQGGLIC